eukprot:XP_027304105.1 ATPase family AAA domain-containing protein 2-like [Anas platyrhynchos]
MFDGDDDASLVSGDELKDGMPDGPEKKRLCFSRSAFCEPTSRRPRLLIVGKEGYGQVSYVAPAVLHALEKFPVHTLDLSVLLTNVALPEEICGQHFRQFCCLLRLMYVTQISQKRQLRKPKLEQKKEYNTVTRTLRSRAGAKTVRRVHGENRDLELRRSCSVGCSRYSTTNSSILFDKLITNTAEVVLQKMAEMEQMRRCQRCWEDVEENLDIFTCVKSDFERTGPGSPDEIGICVMHFGFHIICKST